MLIQFPADVLNTTIENQTLMEHIQSLTSEIESKQLQTNVDIDDVFKTVSTVENILDQIEAARKYILFFNIFLNYVCLYICNYFSDDAFKISVSADYRRVRVTNFAKFETMDHYLEMVCVLDSPSSEMAVVAHSLPLANQASGCFQTAGAIKNHIATFQMCLEQMETFYVHMNTIDELCLVVHPLVVTTKSTMRTFKLGV